jgi:hypothetical protein
MFDTKFTPEHRSTDATLAYGASYNIPAYQRPYVWDCLGRTDRDSQISQLWEDLWQFFTTDERGDREYFLGSIVVIERNRLQFEVVDGQQRLTSLILLLAAISCFIQRRLADPASYDPVLARFLDQIQRRLDEKLFNEAGVELVREPKVKVQRGPTQRAYDDALRAAVTCAPRPPKASNEAEQAVVDRYFRNRDFLGQRVADTFLTDGQLTIVRATQLEKFLLFLLQRVSLVQIRTLSEDTAFTVFEILNNRGLPLSNVDLLRNFVLQHLSELHNAQEAEQIWSTLESDGLNADYVARWAEVRLARTLTTSAFNEVRGVYQRDLQEIPGNSRISQLVQALKQDLEPYAAAVNPRANIADPVLRARVQFLLNAGNTRYLTNFIFALFRQLQFTGAEPAEPATREILHAVLAAGQRYMTRVLRGNLRFSNGVTFTAIHRIQKSDWQGTIEVFDDRMAANELDGLLRSPMYDNDVAAVFVACCAWLDEAEAHRVGAAVGAYDLHVSRATLEHILPQRPAPHSAWLAAFTEEQRSTLTWLLGNLTLLTVRSNASAKNRDFVIKQERYRTSNLPMVRDLAGLPTFGPDELLARHERMVTVLLAHLTGPKLLTPGLAQGNG